MKIYRPESRGRMFTIFAQPGRDYPETSSWLENDGKPKSFEVKFVDGMAEIDKNLAQYLLDKKMAQKSPIILPKGIQL